LEIRKVSKRDITEDSGFFEDRFSNSEVTFPLSKIQILGQRVSLSFVAYTMNPFFGARYP